ncbi:GDP-mannose-dependent alpha-(1-6)-phosphatidylinositol monomannoside mannosyltransferase [Posidoniimonas corsicana]|uniref:GDP-mannose-dependent alpha-(1-6)-phosphatidylinositol monomannoside mannosyltransferase n=1 Tax=Posidoniimonas corsicana TaxID=1938618 RepID=A0A5C5V7N9_9BACT|nr:glycosyltransferase family 4 protein [Posidoniimonas corsicana]TWT33775.1 GDP-mannose-dependent alpha-(1-6)-phosphatidylinositol monomannoside mannosyltransferase [Posidoniimonas corsicana]
MAPEAESKNGGRRKIGRVLVISEVFPPQIGGSGRWLYEVFSRASSFESIHVLAPPLASQGAVDEVCPELLAVSRTYRVPEDAGFFVPRGMIAYAGLVWEVVRLHRLHRFERVYCGSCVTPGWVAWLVKKVLRIPYVCFVHGEEVFFPEDEPPTGLLSSRQLRFQMRLIVSSADRLIANSNNTARLLEESWGVPSERLRVMHPGVDASHYVPTEYSPSIRARLGWSGKQVVLTVGRLQRRKGHDMMIRAMPRILESAPDVLYVIVGNGGELDYLRSLVNECGVQASVVFRTDASDTELLQMYQQCDLFALPNRRVGADIEGFGIVLLEAQACGKPVVAGRSGGTRETLKEGVSGVLVDCGDPDSIAREVLRMLADERRLVAMGNAARQWIEGNFDWSKLACELLN